MPQQERCGSVPTNGIAFARFCPVQRQLTWASNEGAAEDRLLRKGRGSGRPEKGVGYLALAATPQPTFCRLLLDTLIYTLQGTCTKKTGFGS